MEDNYVKKLDMKSADIVSENIETIGKLFPNCVTEGKIDFDLLKQELSNTVIENTKERYQLTWPGKKQSIIEANTATTKTLRPIREKSVNFDSTKNVYIEGDNLDALKVLQESYLKKIKCIYIDPPYNTGNDFIYNDNFEIQEREELFNSGYIDEENHKLMVNTLSNGRFHSDWISMMYSRIKLSRNLLKDDGFIFISIDENELFNLKKICDEIFGENNFRSIITVMANPGGRDYGGIAKTTEYILVYSKTENAIINKVEDESHVFEMKDELGVFELRELRNRNTVFNDKNRPNLCYPFYIDPNDKDEYGLLNVALEPDEKHNVKVMPLVSQGIQTVWRWGKEERARRNLNINIKGKIKQDGTYMIVEKYRDEKVMIKNTWLDKKFRTENGSVELRELFGEKSIFGYPKPIEITELICELCTNKDDIVLDFFSGSASTAHAIMNYNSRKKENIRYILVQLPEKCEENSVAYKNGYQTICDIGEERIRRAGEKIRKETNADIDYGFRVYRVDSSNMEDVYYEPSKLQQSQLNIFESNIKQNRTAEDILTQVVLDWALTLDLKIEEKEILGNKVFFVADNSLVACFDNKININIINQICETKPLKVVFRESSFSNDSDKINAYERIKKLSPETEISVI